MSSSTPAAEQTGIQSTRNPAARAALLSLVLLSLGHFSVDLYSSALGALQPLLVDKFRLSLTQAGFLGGMLVFSSSLTQPLYGYLADRFHTRLFVALAPAVAGVFISSLGIAPGYAWLMLMVVLGGAGVASFHPQASSKAVIGLEESRGRAMAIFVSCGTLGFALGPTYFSAVISAGGLEYAHWAALPGVLVTVFLLWVMPGSGPETAPPAKHFDWAPLRAVWKPMAILFSLVFIRSIVQVAFGQFLPLYLHLERGYPVTQANHILSAYLAGGALGGFFGGHMADRFGGRLVIIVSMIASVPFLALFFFTSGILSISGLCLGGFILFFTIPVNVTMAQELAPAQTGTVSALMMGFAWGSAGLAFIPLTGWIADMTTLQSALSALLVFPVAGFLLSLRLDKNQWRKRAKQSAF